jgi:hypothetical protein
VLSDEGVTALVADPLAVADGLLDEDADVVAVAVVDPEAVGEIVAG